MFKKGVFVLLCIVFLPGLLFAGENVEALFKRGNELYSQSKYKEAISAYQEIIKQDYQSPEVYFNLGNAYYKTGEIPSAVLYYEKARKLNPSDPNINLNLRIANLKTSDKIEAAPEFFLSRWWRNVFMFFSINTWAVLAALFVLMGSALLILYRYSLQVSVKKAAFFLSLIFFFLGLSTLFLSATQAAYFNQNREAVIFAGAVSVKSEPKSSAKTVFIIHAGTKVQLSGKESEWLKVHLANGNEGWINVSDVREI